MLPTLSASLAMLLFLPPARSQQEPRPPQDPEATETGRRSYLGREVAHTMHWSGAGWLMRKTREDEENGVLLRRWLAVQPGQAVCDLGCGNGYHTLPLAESVGNDGRVLAVDLQPQMLTMLKRARAGSRPSTTSTTSRRPSTTRSSRRRRATSCSWSTSTTSCRTPYG